MLISPVMQWYKRQKILYVLSVALLAFGMSNAVAQNWNANDYRPAGQTRQKNRWENRHGGLFSFFNRPVKDTPSGQYRYAEQMREAEKLRKAANMYKALLRKWPDSAQAPAAQLGLAEVLEKRGKYQQAFDEYQYLIEAYAGFFPYDQVVERQMAIAHKVADARRWFLFVPYKSPEQALPLFEQIIANAPHASGSDSLQITIADLYMKAGQYEMAIEAYLSAMQKYVMSPILEDAAYGYAMSYLGLSEKYPNSHDFRENAVQALSVFLRRHPASRHASRVRLELERVRMKQAESLYRQARTYDFRRKKPVSALLVYEQLAREYPDSKWVEPARIRIDRIRQQHGDKL